MGLWGGHSAGGWSSQNPAFRSMGGIKRTDGWDDEELGKLYDHRVMRRLVPYLRAYKRPVGLPTQLSAHIQKPSLSFLARSEVGRVMSRVQNDVNVLQELLTTGLLTILADFAGLGIVIFFLLSHDLPLALVTFTVVPLLIIVMAVWQAQARKAFIRV